MAWQPIPRNSAQGRRLRGTLTGTADPETINSAPVDPRPMPSSEQAPAPMPGGNGGASQRGNLGSALLRGLGNFLGYVPKGGTRGDTPELVADIARGLLGERSIRDVETEANQRRIPEELRRAVEIGAQDDFTALERLDPERAMNLRRARAQDATAAELARLEEERRPKRELARTAFAISRETGLPYGEAIRLIEEDIGREVLSPEERMAAEAGSYPALLSALGEDDPYGDLFRNMGGNTVLDLSGGAVTGPGFIQRPQTEAERDELLSKIEERAARAAAEGKRADAAMLNAQANYLRAQKYQPGGGADTASKANFFRNQMENNINEMRGLLDRGIAAGAFPTTDRGRLAALQARGLNIIDDLTGGVALAGTERQQVREQLSSAAWSTANVVRGLLESNGVKVGATQLNTEKEAERFVNTIANPNATAETIDAALARMERAYLQDMALIGQSGGGGASNYSAYSGQPELPTLTVEQAASVPSGTRFRGTDGNIYTKP